MSTNLTIQMTRRQLLLCGAALLQLSACEAKTMTHATLDVVLFSYLDRPIFEVYLNGKGGDSAGAFPETGGSTIVGVTIPFGPQKVTWRLDGPEGMARNGETVKAKNVPVLNVADIPKGAVFLALHVYPDDTVELISTVHYPDYTARGLAFVKGRK